MVKSWKLEADFEKSWKLEAEFGKVGSSKPSSKKVKRFKLILKKVRSFKSILTKNVNCVPIFGKLGSCNFNLRSHEGVLNWKLEEVVKKN